EADSDNTTDNTTDICHDLSGQFSVIFEFCLVKTVQIQLEGFGLNDVGCLCTVIKKNAASLWFAVAVQPGDFIASPAVLAGKRQRCFRWPEIARCLSRYGNEQGRIV